MDTTDLRPTLVTLFAELVDGAPKKGAFMLNGGDEGLVRALDRLSAAQASAIVNGGSSIAAHVDHVRYGLSLMNRWALGEQDPFADADWTASWHRTTVTEDEWKARRGELGVEAHRWLAALDVPRDAAPIEVNGMVGSIAHLAYHLGAIRQMDRAMRGPGAED